MTGRNYDYILTLADVSNFVEANNVIGGITGTVGTIANVNHQNNTLKVKVDNTIQAFSSGEMLYSNATTVTSFVSSGINSVPFRPAHPNRQVTTASSMITASPAPSTYIAEKNAFHQRPLVRLYTLYYPGEWYPPNLKGNPGGEGAGLSWPAGFPYRFAEVRGDIISDLQYAVEFDGLKYTPYPIDSSGISIDSDGRIGEVTFTCSNFDNLITVLVEDPNLVGNNTANAQSATVNGETVGNIDPRTIRGNALYDQSVVDMRGGTNLPFDFVSTEEVDGKWQALKLDTRDLLGGIIEIRTTFANFLDVWPEYSTVKSLAGESVEVITSLPYRENDVITTTNRSITATIQDIRGNFLVTSNSEFGSNLKPGDPIYIVNDEADPENFSLDTFKIDSLDGLDERVATFKLASWLQHFRLQLPKRRFLKNTCPWVYKGEECQYPSDGRGVIPGTSMTANGFYDIQNEPVTDVADDVCAKNFTACNLRRNSIHFGAFAGTGRTIPR